MVFGFFTKRGYSSYSYPPQHTFNQTGKIKRNKYLKFWWLPVQDEDCDDSGGEEYDGDSIGENSDHGSRVGNDGKQPVQKLGWE